ncbi:hypothetical protein KSP39_PZI004800 [Platanthera zijinensis]|uniref:Amidase domain-containing protein n=1 Tax=Platanthera zijinensis TaxID=2320716 RepID=A0AAP0GCT0_9ASPA
MKLRLIWVQLRPLLQAPFEFEEATVAGIQAAFKDGSLTSYQLVQHYLNQIAALNPKLNAVIEVNPDALDIASEADRRRSSAGGPLGPFDGIPVLVKDSISTRDKLNTTSCSPALLGSVVPRDAGVIKRLRDAGAVILGKASMSEWDHFRSLEAPQGWSPRGGQGRSPYPAVGNHPCGSSSGSAIAVAANLVAVSLATDLFASITCPAVANSVVGIKPTSGLTSRSGIVPISPRFDTVGPMARTMEDAAALLDVIAGYDPLDAEMTAAAAGFIPSGGFRRLLNPGGLSGKRLGIMRHPYFDFPSGSTEEKTFASHFETMSTVSSILEDDTRLSWRFEGLFESKERDLIHESQTGEAFATGRARIREEHARGAYFSRLDSGALESVMNSGVWLKEEDLIDMNFFRLKGAELIDNLTLKNESVIDNYTTSGQSTFLLAEFKISVNAYLKDLVSSPSRSLADVIAFNKRHPVEERMGEFGQPIFLASEETKGIGAAEQAAIKRMEELSEQGLYKLMKEKRLDAVVFPLSDFLYATSIGGFPEVTVPAGYSGSGKPFGICFAGLQGSDSTLIEIAYAFEQATNARKEPNLTSF